MAVEGLGSADKGIAFLVSGGVVYEIIAAACSSPQTTEINASARAETLMKWVHIGLAQSALFTAVAAIYSPGSAMPILIGAFLAAGILYWSYLYACKCGLESSEPGTEN